ncbi:MAG: energy transducer TonB [Armatimonadota bacterium]
MARRKRRKGNPLLTRILLISVVVHIIALPIAAHYGAFKNIGRGKGDSHIVMLVNSPKDSPEQAKEKAKKETKKIEHKSSDAKANDKAKGNNLPQPKVVTSGPVGGAGDGNGPKAESGSGTAGKVPDAGKTVPKTEPEVKKEPVTEPKVTKTPEPEPKKDPPKTEPIKTPVPKARKIVEASVLDAPEPEIPDDLRSEPLDKTLIVEAEIDSGGHPIKVIVSNSTGIKELDRIGLETAKKYRFKPATIDGRASEQRVRFRINFKVE